MGGLCQVGVLRERWLTIVFYTNEGNTVSFVV